MTNNLSPVLRRYKSLDIVITKRCHSPSDLAVGCVEIEICFVGRSTNIEIPKYVRICRPVGLDKKVEFKKNMF